MSSPHNRGTDVMEHARLLMRASAWVGFAAGPICHGVENAWKVRADTTGAISQLHCQLSGNTCKSR
eukprot:1342867-Amphidinium_carterae.2